MPFRDDQQSRAKLPAHDLVGPAGAGEIPAILGSYDAAGKFKFNSERDRINWLRKGYRQGTNPEAFEKGSPLHPDVEAAYASGAVEAPHHVFQGPDGKFRGKNAATQDSPEVHEIRMRAWDGKQFKDVDPHAEKHVGEDEAMKVMTKAKLQTDHVVAPLVAARPRQLSVIEPGASHQSAHVKDPASNLTPALSLPTSNEDDTGKLILARFVPEVPGGFELPVTPFLRSEIPSTPKLPVGDLTPPTYKLQSPLGNDATSQEPATTFNSTTPSPQRVARPSGVFADKQKTNDYDPVYDRLPLSFWRGSPHHFSPEGAAGDALDQLSGILSEKSSDWTELGGNAQNSVSEYQNAVDTVLDRAEDWYRGRFKAVSSPSDRERMRRYVEPRLLQYFPEMAQQQIADWKESPDSTLRIKNGAQDLTTVLRAFYYGNLVDISVDGKTVYAAAEQPSTMLNKRPGSRGNIITTRYNDMVRETVDDFLKECFGKEAVTHVGGGQKYNPREDKWENVKEAYVPDFDQKLTKGSKRSDVAFKIRFGDMDCIFHINTADVIDGENSERERINAEKMRDNFKKLALNLDKARGRWELRFKNDVMARQNALLLTDKPTDGDEVALRAALEAFARLLDCGKIEGECRASHQMPSAEVPSQ